MIGYGLNVQGTVSSRKKWFLSSPSCPYQLWSLLSPPTEWILGPVSPCFKRPHLEADNSTPAGVEMKIVLLCTYIYLYAFMAWCLINPSLPRDDYVAQFDGERIEHHINSSENVHSNGRPFKLLVFCWVHWAQTSGIEGLSTEWLFHDTFEGDSTVCLAFTIFMSCPYKKAFAFFH